MYLNFAQTARHVSEVSLRKKHNVIFYINYIKKAYFCVLGWWRRWSRNKVAVEESVAGENVF